jgi:hypothetical protein
MQRFRVKELNSKHIFETSFSHLLNLNDDPFEESFIANAKLAKNVFEYDSFRKTNKFTLEYTDNPRQKRRSALLKTSDSKHIFETSFSHLLNLNDETFENSFIANAKLAKNVFDYDSFRKTNNFSLEYTKNPRQKRRSDLLTSLVGKNYEDLLVTNPHERKKLFLKTHVLFVDFVRRSYDKTGALDEMKKYSDYPNHMLDILKQNLPENRFVNEDKIEEKGIEPNSLVLSDYVEIQEIPLHLRNQEIEEISNEMTLFHALTLVRVNTKIMKKLGLSNSEFIVYIITYFMFLQEILKNKDKLSQDSYNLLIDVIDEIEILYLGVQVNISNEKLSKENTNLKDALATSNNLKTSYFHVIERYESIEIMFIDNENTANNEIFLRNVLNVTYEYTIATQGDNFFIKSANPNQLLSLYKLLYDFYVANANVFVPLLIIKPDGVKIDTLGTYAHTIHTKSTPWSYVFFKLYGPGVPFSTDRDKTVKAIIKLSEVNNIPLYLLLPKSTSL